MRAIREIVIIAAIIIFGFVSVQFLLNYIFAGSAE